MVVFSIIFSTTWLVLGCRFANLVVRPCNWEYNSLFCLLVLSNNLINCPSIASSADFCCCCSDVGSKLLIIIVGSLAGILALLVLAVLGISLPGF